MSHDLESVAATLVADGKGILAADETVPTLTKRFDTLSIPSTEQSRRTYREMLFTAPGAAEFISGVIMQDETIRQKSSDGTPLAEVLSKQDILPGIKVDIGAKPLAGSPGETVTEGLDGLRDRLSEYHGMGARFAKWRAVIHITDALPSVVCVSANAHALARYAALCQEQDLVPIVEPEVLMDGSHSMERCEEVTGTVLHAVFRALFEQGIALERMLLKPTWSSPARSGPIRPQCRKSQRLRCAACVGMCPRQCPASCSCRVARTIASPRSIWTQSTDCLGPNRGGSVSLTGARSRITRWRRGMAGTRTSGPAGRPCTNGPAATARPVSAGIRMRWRRHRYVPAVRRIAASGATTDMNMFGGLGVPST